MGTSIGDLVNSVPGGVFSITTGTLGTIVLVSRMIVQDILTKEMSKVKAELTELKQNLAATQAAFENFKGVVESLNALNIQVAEIRREMKIRTEHYLNRD